MHQGLEQKKAADISCFLGGGRHTKTPTTRGVSTFGKNVPDVRQFVVFMYRNKLFPGKIVKYDDQGATVSSIVRNHGSDQKRKTCKKH